MLKLFIPLALAAAAIVPVSASQAADGPGSCGEYRYWHDGKCVDARDASSKSWSDTMAAKSAW